jgi:RNA polymerase sigma-70 factor (ECF subfamily)
MGPPESARRWEWLAEQADGLRRSLRGRLESGEAEDVVQEAILRASASAGAPSQDGHRGAWLYRIARNIATDRWRRERQLVPLNIAAHVTVEPELSDTRIDLAVALKQLRPSDRQLLMLVSTGIRYSEIARTEGVDASVIRQRVARARARVLALLREEP